MGTPGNYIGALDLGTTSDRFIIFDRSGGIVGVTQDDGQNLAATDD
jgi:glycerol kinase